MTKRVDHVFQLYFPNRLSQSSLTPTGEKRVEMTLQETSEVLVVTPLDLVGRFDLVLRGLTRPLPERVTDRHRNRIKGYGPRVESSMEFVIRGRKS